MAKTRLDVALVDIEWVNLESLDLIHFLKSTNPAMEIVVLTPIAAASLSRGTRLLISERLAGL